MCLPVTVGYERKSVPPAYKLPLLTASGKPSLLATAVAYIEAPVLVALDFSGCTPYSRHSHLRMTLLSMHGSRFCATLTALAIMAGHKSGVVGASTTYDEVKLPHDLAAP